MSNDSHEPARQPRRRSGCFWIFLAVMGLVVVLVVLVCGGFFVGQMQAGREVERELARLQAAGEPTNAGELGAFYAQPPDDRDVTALWIAAIRPLDTPAFSDDCRDLPIVGNGKPIPPPGQPWPELPEVEKLLAQYAESLATLHEAARRGGSARFPVKFEDGFNMLLPHAQSLRGAARLLALEAHVRARRGDPNGAAESIHAVVSAGESLREEPILVSQLVRIAVLGVAQDALQKLLPATRFSDEDLARLQARLQNLNYDEGIRRALMGERVMLTMAILDPASLDQSGNMPAGVSLLISSKESARLGLTWMNRAIALTRVPLPERLDEAEALNVEIRDFAAGAGLIKKVRHMPALLFTPAVTTVIAAGARGNATAQVAATAIAAHRWRLRHGKLPASLDQLVPEFLPAVPVDPFDGRPLRFAIREKEIVVYSVGPNRIDDGGVPLESDRQGDLVFPLTPP